MASRAHFKDSLFTRGSNLSLLAQASGEQSVSWDTLRSGMLVKAAQVMTQPEGSF